MTAPGGALLFLMGLIFSGLAVDVSNVLRLRAMLQSAADAAVLAAVQSLPDEVEARAVAAEFVERMLPAARHGTVLAPADLVIGAWDDAARTITPPSGFADAAVMTLTLNPARGNAPGTSFLRIIGLDDWALTVQVAATNPMRRRCKDLRAGQGIVVTAAAVASGACAYGRAGIDFGIADVSGLARAGARAGSPVASDTIGSGLWAKRFDADLRALRAERLPAIIDRWVAGTGAPGGMEVVETVDLPADLSPRTIYVVTGDLAIRGVRAPARDVVIAVRGNLSIEPEAILSDVGQCADHRPLGLYAEGNVTVGADAAVQGADIVAGGDVTVETDAAALQAAIEAGGSIHLGLASAGVVCWPRYSLFNAATGLLKG